MIRFESMKLEDPRLGNTFRYTVSFQLPLLNNSSETNSNRPCTLLAVSGKSWAGKAIRKISVKANMPNL
ncbi:MAG: hypothetical protein ABJC10_03195 [Acidobacteriota bacterium]